MAIRVGLDHRDHARRAIGPFGADKLGDGAVVGVQRVQIDTRGCRTHHSNRCLVRLKPDTTYDSPIAQAAPAARFSNRVNSRMNASLTTPVGPLRCLPMMSSATPCASTGESLSAYCSSR